MNRRVWIAGLSILIGCLLLSSYPLLWRFPAIRYFAVGLGIQLVLIPFVLLLLFGKQWGVWHDGEQDRSTAQKESVSRIWRIEGILLLLGGLSVSAYPLLEFHTAIRNSLLLIGVQLLLLIVISLFFFGRSLGLRRDTRIFENEAERDVEWTRSIIMSFSFFGLMAVYVFAASVQSPFSWLQFGHVAGIGSLYSAAFFGVGALMGFLFGVPRSLRSPSKSEIGDHNNTAGDSAQAGQRPSYAANTNLEDISDWLTKIIVGLGLINLKQIPQLLKGAGTYFGSFCGKDYCESVALAMMMYFFVCGFFLGYLMTRLYLTRAFDRSERQPETIKTSAEAEPSEKLEIKAEKIGDGP